MDGQVNEWRALPEQEGDEHGRGTNLQRLQLGMKDTGGELGQRDNIIYFTSPVRGARGATGRVCANLRLNYMLFFGIVRLCKEFKYGIERLVGKA